MCLDVALEHRRGDPFVVVDLQETGWVERYTASDKLARPAGEELIQAQMPMRPGETAESAAERLEQLLDASYRDWRERETWRRRQVMDGRTGALDLPGKTWRDRPAIDRGDGVLPRRRHGRRARVPVGDRLGQRGRGEPAGLGGRWRPHHPRVAGRVIAG